VSWATDKGFITLDQERLRTLAARLMDHENGAKLKRQMVKDLKPALEPALPVIRGELMAMGGSLTAEPALRATVAANLSTSVRTTGDAPGVRVAISRKGMPRGFANAARRINDGQWAHPVYGRGSVEQRGARGFFDDPLNARREEMRSAIAAALDSWADSIARGL
jgi:hypothetical protein